MKMTKKLLAMFLVAVLVMSVGIVSAMAADDEEVDLFGTIEDNVYTNEYFGFSCTLDEDWAFFTDEELLLIMGITADVLSETDLAEYMDDAMEDTGLTSVMGAYSEDGAYNINVTLQDVSAVLPGILGKLLTEETVVDLAFGEEAMEVWESMELQDLSIEKNTYELAGEEHAGVAISFVDTSLGIEVPIYEQMVFVLVDGYYLQITMTSYLDDTGIPTMTDFFAPLTVEE